MSAKWPVWLRELSAAFAKDRSDENRMLFSDGIDRWRKGMYAAGLCLCGEALSPTSSTACAKCAVKQNFRVEARRDRLLAAGKCWVCGQRPHRVDVQTCAECAVPHGQRAKDYCREKKAAKLCVTCKEPTKGRGVKCHKHRVAESKKASARFRERREAGLCATCSKPSPNKYLCPECREKHNKGRRKTPDIVDAMKVVLEYETEWFATGVVVKDERYLVAKELVERRAI